MTNARPTEPRTRRSFRTVQLLGWSYLGLSVLALVVIFLLRNHPAEVNDTAWIRAIIVAATAVLLIVFVERMTGGSRGAHRRLRFISIGIAVIVAIPGMLPLWMTLEQSVCGLLMIGVALVVNGRHLRELFAAEASEEGVPPSTT
jgi:phosphatidylserine synthase